MANTSGSYDFLSVQVEPLIRDAYENIGIAPEMLTPQKLDSARRSINLLLLEWMNKSTNLWTLHSGFLALNEFQSSYVLPNYVSDLTEVNLRSSNRVLGGTPASSNGGIAANAFDGSSATACSQDAPDGNISYDYGEEREQNISFCGITSHANLTYNLNIEASNDNANWQNILAIPTKAFTAGQLYWFDIPAPTNARYYRIRETGGATLNIQDIYFNNNVTDTVIGSISRNEYLSLPEKKLTGRPSSYYFDRKITPILNLWPAPSSLYNATQYSYKKMMQDVGLYTNSLDIPARFYPALTTGLSYKLSLKYNNQIADMLMADYQESFSLATIEDSGDNIISIIPKWQDGGYAG